jgi:hypothetical protein
MAPDPQTAAHLRQMAQRQAAQSKQMAAIVSRYNELVAALQDQPRSITQEIDSIPGRRIFYTLSARLPFDESVSGLRATAMAFLVSQDGPFIATHYPMAIWLPSAPDNATNFGAWRPVSTWPLPDQVLDTDLIDISYEIDDTGSQRNFQNEAVAPVLSRPDNLIPLPVPTLFAPNTTIRFTPTFERIVFNQTAEQVATTEGILWVGFPGYKIVNL